MKIAMALLARIGFLRVTALVMTGAAYVSALLGRAGFQPKGLAPNAAPAFQPAVRQGADGKTEMHIAGEIVDASLAMWFGDAPGFVSSEGVSHVLANNKIDRAILNSVGGDVTEGTNIANQLRARNIPVVVNGAAYSIASVILAAAKDATILPGSVVMVHKPHSGVHGNATSLRATADALDKYEEAMLDIYVRGKDSPERRQYWRDAMTGPEGADGTYYTAGEAVAAGIADRVGTDDGEAKARTTRARAAIEAMGMVIPKNLVDTGDVPESVKANPEPRLEPETTQTVRGRVMPRGAVILNTNGDK
jgi:ATP-dependent protease ClpP protease subunit